MTDTLQQIALSRALRTLDAIGAQYAVIYNDETYGVLKLAPPPRKRKDGFAQYKRGETHRHYWPLVKDLRPGEVAQVPYDIFESAVLIGHICAACTHAWGKGSYVSKRNDETQTVDLLRLS